MEQTLGHRTHTDNIANYLDREERLDTVWMPVPWEGVGPGRDLPVIRSNWTLRSGLAARQLLRANSQQGRLDGLFVHTQVPAMLLGRWTSRVPTVISLDATPRQYDQLGAHYQHQVGPPLLERAKHTIHRRRIHEAAALVTWSDWARQGLVEDYGVDPDRVTVISPGVHRGMWQRPRRPSTPTEPVRVLFVGGDFERKGGTSLLAAFRRLRSASQGEGQPSVHLDLVTGSDLPAEPGITVHQGLTANSTELIDLYHQADIFCLPTLGDCLPMVLSEAGAAGLPLVSTDVGAISEIVRDGETGVIVPPGDSESLHRALARLVADSELRQRLGANAEALVADRHDAEANARTLVDLILDVAGNQRQPRTILTVSGTVDPDLDARVHSGVRPRADYTELAAALGDAEILDRAAVSNGLSALGRAAMRLVGPDVMMAWVCFRRRSDRDLLFTDGEQVGLPFAVMCRLGGRRRLRHAMICHVMSPPEKALPFRLLGLDRHIDVYFTYATAQTRLLIAELGVPPGKVVQTSFMVDTEFFEPQGDPVDPPMICAVGLERRDYPTLFAAVRDLDVRVIVAAASPWSKQSTTTSESEVPPNVEVCRLDPVALREVYEQSRFLVMPLLPVDFQAGITSILEAMSMARPVICSAIPGQTDTIVDGVTGVYVPHSDPQSLRRAIEELLADPERTATMGRAARRHVVEQCDVRVYADRLAAAARRPSAPRGRSGARVAATFVMEQHLGHATYAANLRSSLAAAEGIDQHWIDVRYGADTSRLGRLPGLPEAIAAPLRARAEVRAGWPDRTDVAVFNTQVPASLTPWVTRRYPYIVAVDVTPAQYDRIADQYRHDADSSSIVRSLKHRHNRTVFHRASAIAAWSSWVRESLIDDYQVPAERIAVIPPGVDTAWWAPPPRPPQEDSVQILFVGGDFHRKGGDVLLEAFSTLPEGRANLVLVTKTPVQAPPGVRVEAKMEPNSDALRALYHQSDIFVLAARAEAFGIAAVEASAAGLPVIASDVGGLTDIVADEETGLVVSPDDAQALAAALTRLIDDPDLRQRLGDAARRRALERFDASRNADRLLGLLRAAAAD
jgi:glycosyltransferase involved in cell wall biosynthesis